MKKTLLIAFAIMLAGASATAQDDKFGPNKDECLKYLSYYEEYYKQKAYDEALPNWRQAYKYCPAASRQTMLVNGTTLIRRLIIQNSKNPEYRKSLIDTLLTLHNQRAEFFPKARVTALNNKGQDLFNYVKNDDERLNKEYAAIIAENAELTKPTLFVHSYNVATNLYKAGKIGAEELLTMYQNYAEVLAKIEGDEATSAKAELESRFIQSGVASCDNLIALLTPKYEADPNSLELSTKIVKMLNMAEDCAGNDLYLKAVTTMYQQNPSYNSAYALYRLNSSKGNIDDAIKYLNEAIVNAESDDKTDGEYYYELAAYAYKNGRTGLAFDSALKAAELNTDYAGKAYFLVGNIWGGTSCGGDEIARRAPYWVAVDYMQKAKEADPSLADEANKYIGMYSKYYPQTADAFMYDLTDGQTYTVTCGGMRATTRVRTQK